MVDYKKPTQRGFNIITRVSPLTGDTTALEIPMSHEEFDTRYVQWQNGALIQDAFPMFTPSGREFIMTGYTESDWERMFPRGNDG